jgi:myo-inositol 2-dehydrogenase/D-chiro-inositol 1-dehydrogenase
VAGFRICSIGCGRLANSMHGPSLALYRHWHAGVQLAACCDTDAGKAARFKERFGYEASYTGVEEMLDAERPDAVTLVVPPTATAALAVAVIDKGYAVLMEKPPGLGAVETRSIISAARKTGVATRVAFNRRYMPITVRLKELLCADPGARLDHINCDFYRVGRTDADFSTTAIHAVDTVRFLAGEDYASVRFVYVPRARPAVGDIFLECRFRSGCRAHISFCPAAGTEMERLTLNAGGTTWLVDLPGVEPVDPPGAILQFVRGARTCSITEADLGGGKEVWERTGFYGENATFFDDLQAGRRPAGGVGDSLQSVEIADCIRAGKESYGERE